MSEEQFGVRTSNAFMLLDDEAPKKVVKAAKKEEPAAAPKKEFKPKEGSRRQQAHKDGERKNRTEGGRGGRGRGRGRGGRAPREGKREFDRHESGTGRDRRAKKDGAGKYNWGAEGEEGTAREGADRPRRNRNDRRRNDRNKDEKKEGDAEKTEGAEEKEGEAAEKPADAEPAEPEEVVFTLDEYLSKKATVEEDNRELRAPGTNNAKNSTLKEAVVFEKVIDETDTYAYPQQTEKAKKNKKDKKKAGKISLDEFTKPANNKSRGGARGGRSDRGRRAGGRGGRDNANFQLGTNDFPALGK